MPFASAVIFVSEPWNKVDALIRDTVTLEFWLGQISDFGLTIIQGHVADD
jgi:hypothetical protein